MINYGHGTVGFVLTFISLVHILLAALISLVIVIILIYEQVYRHVKRIDQVTLVIFTLIYCLIFIYGIVLSTINIQTLLGDIYGTNFDSTWCRFNGYWMIVLICAIYQIFVVQVDEKAEYSIIISIFFISFRLSFVFVELSTQTIDNCSHTRYS